MLPSAGRVAQRFSQRYFKSFLILTGGLTSVPQSNTGAYTTNYTPSGLRQIVHIPANFYLASELEDTHYTVRGVHALYARHYDLSFIFSFGYQSCCISGECGVEGRWSAVWYAHDNLFVSSLHAFLLKSAASDSRKNGIAAGY
jgi:hypothetical protein